MGTEEKMFSLILTNIPQTERITKEYVSTLCEMAYREGKFDGMATAMMPPKEEIKYPDLMRFK